MQTISLLQPMCFPSFRRLGVKPDKWMRMKEGTLFQLSKGRLVGRGNLNSLFLIPLKHQSLFSMLNSTDGPVLSSVDEDSSVNNSPMLETETWFSKWSPPSYLWRGLSVLILAGQVIIRTLKGKVHWRNTLQQLERAGPKSVGVCLLTAAFVGMAFTIQFVREFTRLGLNCNTPRKCLNGLIVLSIPTRCTFLFVSPSF